MQLIEPLYKAAEYIRWQDDSLLFTKIQAVLHSQRIGFHFLSASQTQMKLIIELKNKPPQQRLLTSLWTFTIGEYLQIRVDSCFQNTQPLPIDPPPKMKEFLKVMNATSYGTYFTDVSNASKISFRQRFPFQTTKSYVSAYIRELYIQISVQFRKYAVFCKLLPETEEISCKKMGDTLVRLKLLKQQFQFARQQRKKHTSSYNFSNNSIKLVSQSLRLINLCIGKLKAYSWDAKIDIGRAHKIYQKSSVNICEAIKKERDLLPKYIVKGIQIENVSNQLGIDEGGFSQIKLGTYVYTQLITCNEDIIKSQSQPPLSSCKSIDAAKQKPLVRKLPKNELDFSHLNEHKLLQFLRNKKDSRIAEYYLSKSLNEQYNKGIYMQYYQTNLVKAYQSLKEAELLKVCRQILQGIYFFWQNKILHRDLKELNILIDQSGNARLIDFGSASGFISNSGGQFQAHSNKLMATRGYFFPYKDIPIAGVSKKFTVEQYQQAQTFDMYSFGQILNNLFFLHNIQDDMVHRQLIFLARRCQEINPQDRIYPLQALCYLKEIINLHIQQNSMVAGQVKTDIANNGQKKSTNSTSQQ